MMKTRLLTLLLLLGTAAAKAQVTVYVQQPPGLEGPLEFTWANDWGQTPDLNNTANNVTAFACFVDDGTTADSLGCGTLVNAAELAGKIAVVYRGSCEFGVKALNAQNAGAVAVVIINNAAGAPVGMGAGAQGANITIPVVMISQDAGAALASDFANCAVELFIGSQTNFYQFNLGFYKNDILVPRYGEVNSLIASNASEFFVQIGAMMHNYGSAAMDNAAVNATVIKEGNTLYDQTSPPITLNSGDSLYVTLPDFSEAGGYSGQYLITYTLVGGTADEFAQNNSIAVTLTVGDKISYVPSDATTLLPLPNLHVVPAANTLGFRSCISFKDANASRLATTGVWFSASRAADTVLTDEVMTATLYQWNDAVTGPTTLPTDAGLSALTTGEYIFPSDENSVPIYMPFFDVVTLNDNQWYLVCLDSYSGVVRHGWDNSLSYDRLQTITLEPNGCLRDGATWYNGFTGITGPPSLAMQVIDANSIGIQEQSTEVEVTPFPNPTCDEIRIPLKGQTGAARVQVYNTAGTTVLEQRTSIGGDGTFTMDVSDLASGTYLFKMAFDNGQHAEFSVQVVK
ncbi:MAG: T9SS type A sorting domain-containing protein [Flavobacteriales bacterium]|nr:T9SS type A sorting domain-containing protein [Flavobacteriales bacterium]